MSGFTVKVTSEGCLDLFDSDAQYFRGIEATLSFDDLDIGKFTGTLVRGDLVARDGLELVAALDECSDEVALMGATLFKYGSNWYKSSIARLLEPNGLVVFYLSRLTMDPRFRGHQLGLALLQYVLEYVPHDVAIMKPFPLQHDETATDVDAEQFRSVPLKAATATLVRYYSTLGFDRLPRSSLMVRRAAAEYDRVDFQVPDDALAALRQIIEKELQRLVRAGTKTRAHDQYYGALLKAAESGLAAAGHTPLGGLLGLLEKQRGRGTFRLKLVVAGDDDEIPADESPSSESRRDP